MIEAHTYKEVCWQLAERFQKAYGPKQVNLTGLIFAHLDSPFAKAEIIPFIDYWHHRSDNVTDFFCAGFGSGGPSDSPRDKFPVAEIRHDKWWYSSQYFTEFVRDIEAETNWKHSGGTDIIIATARYDQSTGTASLDFRSAIAIDLDEAKKDEAIKSTPHLMQSIFGFAQNINEDTTDPAWEYSDQMGLKITKSTLTDWLLNFLPKPLAKGTKRVVHFAVRDISPKIA